MFYPLIILNYVEARTEKLICAKRNIFKTTGIKLVKGLGVYVFVSLDTNFYIVLLCILTLQIQRESTLIYLQTLKINFVTSSNKSCINRGCS